MDVTGSATWFDPGTGWDLSGALGVTFNAKNTATQYRSGLESHLEAALSRRLPNGLSLGLAGYYYYQLTADRGDGAILGDYKGRVAALGAVGSYDFAIRQQPLTIKFKFFSEFSAQNRVQGKSVFIGLSMPIL